MTSTIMHGRRIGTPDEKQAARAEELRKHRLAVAARKWHTLSSDQVEYVRFYRRNLVVETHRGDRGRVWELLTLPVWPSGDPKHPSTRTT